MMLILSRRKSEQILINGNVIIEVVEIRGSMVRIGITAPPSVVVDRMEVAREKQRKQQEGGGSCSD